MHLTGFVRYLNMQLPWPKSALHSPTPFISEAGRVSVLYANLQSESGFSSVVDTRTGELRGHATRLRATSKDKYHPYPAEAVFRVPDSGVELVFLDRLVRTLHTLNYSAHRGRNAQRLLLLNVHPRHIASAAIYHGLTFENILSGCALLLRQVIPVKHRRVLTCFAAICW